MASGGGEENLRQRRGDLLFRGSVAHEAPWLVAKKSSRDLAQSGQGRGERPDEETVIDTGSVCGEHSLLHNRAAARSVLARITPQSR